MSENQAQRPRICEATIRDLARSQSYDRGLNYYEQGAVEDVVRRGDRLRAGVAGSKGRTYTVTIEFDDDGVATTDCTCPYDHGGICKHRVATLLTSVRDPDRIAREEPIETTIERADEETLAALLVELLEARPEVADWIGPRLRARMADSDGPAGERSAETEDGSASGPRTEPSVSIDVESIRRRAENALPKPGQRGHNDAYAEADRMAEELDGLLEQARTAIGIGDGEAAVEVLLAEGQYDDAIDLADRSGRTDIVEPVVEAAIEERPEWVIETSMANAGGPPRRVRAVRNRGNVR